MCAGQCGGDMSWEDLDLTYDPITEGKRVYVAVLNSYWYNDHGGHCRLDYDYLNRLIGQKGTVRLVCRSEGNNDNAYVVDMDDWCPDTIVFGNGELRLLEE